jgi:hypothetical protein
MRHSLQEATDAGLNVCDDAVLRATRVCMHASSNNCLNSVQEFELFNFNIFEKQQNL